MRSVIASIFRFFLKIPVFRKNFYGLHKRLFLPYGLFTGLTKQIPFRGYRLNLNIDNWIDENIYFTNSYEENELNLLHQYLKAGDCFIDIGANIGIYSLEASKIVGENGRVIAFEPFSSNYNALYNNLALNRSTNIQPEKLAISDKNEDLSLFYDYEELNSGMVSILKKTTYEEKVKSIRLDDYVESKGIEFINYIKLDIEGAELAALRGMENTLIKYRPILQIELDPDILNQSDHKKEDILKILDELNYKPAKHQLTNQNMIFIPIL